MTVCHWRVVSRVTRRPRQLVRVVLSDRPAAHIQAVRGTTLEANVLPSAAVRAVPATSRATAIPSFPAAEARASDRLGTGRISSAGFGTGGFGTGT